MWNPMVFGVNWGHAIWENISPLATWQRCIDFTSTTATATASTSTSASTTPPPQQLDRGHSLGSGDYQLVSEILQHADFVVDNTDSIVEAVGEPPPCHVVVGDRDMIQRRTTAKNSVLAVQSYIHLKSTRGRPVPTPRGCHDP